MSLRDEVKARLNTPAQGGWKVLAMKQSAEVTEAVVDIVGTNLSKGKRLPVLTSEITKVLSGEQHIDDFDVNLLMRYMNANSPA